MFIVACILLDICAISYNLIFTNYGSLSTRLKLSFLALNYLSKLQKLNVNGGRSCGFFVWWNDEIMDLKENLYFEHMSIMEWWNFDRDGIIPASKFTCGATYYQDGKAFWSSKWPIVHCTLKNVENTTLVLYYKIESKYTVPAHANIFLCFGSLL